MFDGPNDSRLKNFPRLNKKDFRTLTGLLTGHCTLRKKLVQIGKGENSICRWCNVSDETSLHVLMKCGAQGFLAKRTKYFNKLFLQEEDLKEIPFTNYIKFSRDTGVQDALCYMPP